MRRILRTYHDAFAGLPREVWWLAGVTLVNRAGTMVLPFLVLYLTRERGYGIGQAGGFLALYGCGSIVGTFLGGRLTDRVGARPVQLSSLALTGLTLFGLGQLRSTLAIGAAVVLLATWTESFRPANSTAVAAATTDAQRPRAYGLQRLAINLGFSLGPVVGGLLAEVNYGLLFWVDGVTCLAAALLLFRTVPYRAPPTSAERVAAARSGRSPWRDRVFVGFLVLTLLQGLVFFQLQGTFVYYLREARGFSEGVIGGLLAVNTVIIVLLEMVLIRRVERYSALRVIAVASVLLGLGYGLLPHGASQAFVIGTIAVWTVGEMLGAPMSMVFVAARSEQANRGRYMGAFAMCFAVSQLVAPILGTRTYAALGGDAVWHGCLALGLVSGLGMFLLAHRSDAGDEG